MPAVAVVMRRSVGSYALIGLPRHFPTLINSPKMYQFSSAFRRLIVFELTHGLSDLNHHWRRTTREVPSVGCRQWPAKSFDFGMTWKVPKCGRLERQSRGY